MDKDTVIAEGHILPAQDVRLNFSARGTVDEILVEEGEDVVEDQVIIELKAIEKLQNIHEAQLLNYLKATKYKIGLLVNFTHPKAEIKRFIF